MISNNTINFNHNYHGLSQKRQKPYYSNILRFDRFVIEERNTFTQITEKVIYKNLLEFKRKSTVLDDSTRSLK